jgi:hypothetical protein
MEVEFRETTVMTLSLPDCLDTLMTQSTVELLLVYSESWSKANECRSKQAAKQQDDYYPGCMSAESAHEYGAPEQQHPISTDTS